MKKNLLIFILLTIITLLGSFLTLYKIATNPPSLTGDEISFGYSAYSILKTGRDEYGKFMPLTFESVGDYKNPLPVYLLVPFIKVLGLNDFSIRLPNALLGILAIPIFFLFLTDILKDKRIALFGSFLLSISAWHIFYSRFAYEPLMASTFVLLGIWFYIKMLDGKYIWGILSAFFLILTMYTAFAPRLFIPVFVFFALISSFTHFRRSRNKIVLFTVICIILALPLMYTTLFGGAGTRFSMVFLSGDIEFRRYVLLKDFKSLQDIPLLIIFWLKRYLNYLQPSFIFSSGLNMTPQNTIGLGMLYLFEFPWLILGVVEFIKRRISHKQILIIWLFTGILPDSLTNNQQHSGRLLHIFPVVILLSTLGAMRFFKWIKDLPGMYIKVFISSAFAILVVIILMHAFLTFAIHFPVSKGESFDEGLREVSVYINNHQDEYKEIVVDPRRGIDGPYLVSNPYLYVLFYTKYDPAIYQTENRTYSSGYSYYYKFNKYTFRPINWSSDSQLRDTLFIGSPWSLSEKDVKPGQILKKIYLSSGQLAFLIVSTK